MALSLEELRRLLDAALLEKFGANAQGFQRYWIEETFPDYLIVRGQDVDLFQIAWSMDANDAITLGDLQPVETAYVPVEGAARFIAAAKLQEDGWVWPVIALKGGWANAQVLTDDVETARLPQWFGSDAVAQMAAAINGARYRRRHPLDHEGDGSLLPELVAGWCSDGRVAGDEAHANVNLLRTETEMRARLMAARDAGKLDLFNVSHYAYWGFTRGEVQGRKALVATKLLKFVGLDMCGEAGAGGKFLGVAASEELLAEVTAAQQAALKNSPGNPGRKNGTSAKADASRITGGSMKLRIIALLAALATFAKDRADLLGVGLDGMAEADMPKRFDEVVDAFVECANGAYTNVNAGTKQDPALIARVQAALAELTKIVKENGGALLTKANEALAKAEKIQFTNLLETKLKAAKLPEQAETIVRTHLKDRVVDETGVDAEITVVRAAFADYTNIGRVSDAGVVTVGRETADKIQLASDAMLGVKAALADPNAKPFRGLRDMYVEVTGDRELRFDKGGFWRVRAAIGTADFPQILLNSMTKRLLQDFAALGWGGLDRLVSFVGVNDYKTQHRTRMGYFGDLSTVAEAGAYTEITKPTDELIQYAVAKKGNLVTVSEETIRNDDLRKIAQIPGLLARAGIRTGKQFVSSFFSSPPTYDADSVAWFHATHNNLGSLALSDAELEAREILLFKQAEKDSAKPLGLPLFGIMIPVDLKATAYQINNNNDGSNSWYSRFGAPGPKPENIIVNELLSDVNDWYYFTDPALAPFVEIGVLDGADGQPPVPQILLANDPTQGTSFTNDQIQYKVKMVFGGDVIDFRGVGKNVVP